MFALAPTEGSGVKEIELVVETSTLSTMSWSWVCTTGYQHERITRRKRVVTTCWMALPTKRPTVEGPKAWRLGVLPSSIQLMVCCAPPCHEVEATGAVI